MPKRAPEGDRRIVSSIVSAIWPATAGWASSSACAIAMSATTVSSWKTTSSPASAWISAMSRTVATCQASRIDGSAKAASPNA